MREMAAACDNRRSEATQFQLVYPSKPWPESPSLNFWKSGKCRQIQLIFKTQVFFSDSWSVKLFSRLIARAKLVIWKQGTGILNSELFEFYLQRLEQSSLTLSVTRAGSIPESNQTSYLLILNAHERKCKTERMISVCFLLKTQGAPRL